MKTRLLIIIGVVLALINVNSAYASQCIGGITLEENYKSYDYIFSGRVESIDYSQAPTNVTLWVYNTWKGNTTQYMSVTAPFHDPLLSFLFVEGGEYLIFSESGYWTNNMTSVSGCSPSGLLSQSHDTIMQLEEITNYTNSKKPCDYTGRECGDSTGIFKEIIKISDAVQAFNFSETVLIGKILSVEILSKTISSPYPCETECSSNGFAFYEVQVEEYLKNPSDTKIIKVLGNYSINSGRGENPPFEVGQTVLLYIQKENRIPGYDVVIRTGDSRVLDGPVSGGTLSAYDTDGNVLSEGSLYNPNASAESQVYVQLKSFAYT